MFNITIQIYKSKHKHILSKNHVLAFNFGGKNASIKLRTIPLL